MGVGMPRRFGLRLTCLMDCRFRPNLGNPGGCLSTVSAMMVLISNAGDRTCLKSYFP